MKYINVVIGPQNASAVIMGCMRMPALSVDEAANMIRADYDLGINFYDHATCYGENGEAENRFGDAFPKTGIKRGDVFIQSKCGILSDQGEFNWTKENIIASVDDSLRRLKCEYLDSLCFTAPTCSMSPSRSPRRLTSSKKAEKSGASA